MKVGTIYQIFHKDGGNFSEYIKLGNWLKENLEKESYIYNGCSDSALTGGTWLWNYFIVFLKEEDMHYFKLSFDHTYLLVEMQDVV